MDTDVLKDSCLEQVNSHKKASVNKHKMRKGVKYKMIHPHQHITHIRTHKHKHEVKILRSFAKKILA